MTTTYTLWPRRRNLRAAARAFVLRDRLRSQGRYQLARQAEQLGIRLSICRRPLCWLVTAERCRNRPIDFDSVEILKRSSHGRFLLSSGL